MPGALTLSHVYLALGYSDAQSVMKVGKANNIDKRCAQIKLDIEVFAECDSEQDAFLLERKLRQMMRASGAQRLRGNDWFVLNADIYSDVRAYLADSVGIDMLRHYRGALNAEDFEVAWLRACYKSMLERQLEAEREARRMTEERLSREIGALQHENRELRKRLLIA